MFWHINVFLSSRYSLMISLGQSYTFTSKYQSFNTSIDYLPSFCISMGGVVFQVHVLVVKIKINTILKINFTMKLYIKKQSHCWCQLKLSRCWCQLKLSCCWCQLKLSCCWCQLKLSCCWCQLKLSRCWCQLKLVR